MYIIYLITCQLKSKFKLLNNCGCLFILVDFTEFPTLLPIAKFFGGNSVKIDEYKDF